MTLREYAFDLSSSSPRFLSIFDLEEDDDSDEISFKFEIESIIRSTRDDSSGRKWNDDGRWKKKRALFVEQLYSALVAMKPTDNDFTSGRLLIAPPSI